MLTGWLREGKAHVPGLRQVFVHALNPYGFAWDRRVTEDNVDLNRNFVDRTAPPPDNAHYALLAEAIAPASLDDEATEAASRALRNYAKEHGAFAMQDHCDATGLGLATRDPPFGRLDAVHHCVA